MTTIDSPVAPIDNGVNVEALLGARDAMTAQPAAAAFTWKATGEWQRGTHVRTTIEQFFGIGADQAHTQAFELETDHPPQFAATDLGVTPGEMVLAGLAGCLTGGIATVAQHRGIELHSVRVELEADMDLRGVLGADADVRVGFSEVRVRFDVDAAAERGDVEALVAQSQKRSAVFDMLTNPTNVTVSVA